MKHRLWRAYAKVLAFFGFCPSCGGDGAWFGEFDQPPCAIHGTGIAG